MEGRRDGASKPPDMTTFTRMPRTQLLVLMSIVIVIAALFANIVDVGNNDEDASGSVGAWVAMSLVGIALTTLLLLVVVPRLRADQRRTAVLGFGVAAVVTVVVFWSTLPFALAAAALAAAGPADDPVEGDAPAPSSAGVILALLAVAAAFVLCVVG